VFLGPFHTIKNVLDAIYTVFKVSNFAGSARDLTTSFTLYKKGFFYDYNCDPYVAF
jgi:hypothetical protein